MIQLPKAHHPPRQVKSLGKILTDAITPDAGLAGGYRGDGDPSRGPIVHPRPPGLDIRPIILAAHGSQEGQSRLAGAFTLRSDVRKEQVGALSNQLSPELRVNVRSDQDLQDIVERERIRPPEER